MAKPVKRDAAKRLANIAAKRQRNAEENERKRWIAESNAEERAKRSPHQQLAVLDARLGKGQGAKKERARLSTLLTA